MKILFSRTSMTHSPRWFIGLGLIFVSALFARGGDSPATRPGAGRETPLVLNVLSSSKPLRNGIELGSAGALMQVTALRDDVVRIRIGLHGQLPEDASWAVVEGAR